MSETRCYCGQKFADEKALKNHVRAVKAAPGLYYDEEAAELARWLDDCEEWIEADYLEPSAVKYLQARLRRAVKELRARIGDGMVGPVEDGVEGTSNCGARTEHPAHRWMLGREVWQCPGREKGDM